MFKLRFYHFLCIYSSCNTFHTFTQCNKKLVEDNLVIPPTRPNIPDGVNFASLTHNKAGTCMQFYRTEHESYKLSQGRVLCRIPMIRDNFCFLKALTLHKTCISVEQRITKVSNRLIFCNRNLSIIIIIPILDPVNSAVADIRR